MENILDFSGNILDFEAARLRKLEAQVIADRAKVKAEHEDTEMTTVSFNTSKRINKLLVRTARNFGLSFDEFLNKVLQMTLESIH